MNENDYYAILGVARDASAEEIKRAYRKRALDLHPDRNPDRADAEEHFKRLTEAYSVLGDPEKRTRYDQFGPEGVAAAGGPFAADPSIFADLFGGAGLGGLESLFERFFGPGFFGGVGARGPRDGGDIHQRVEISFEQAVFGAEIELRVGRSEACGACSGTGAAPGGLVTCRTCRGAGRVATRMGFVQIAQTCPGCGGRGRMIQERCRECRGAGRVEAARTIPIRSPAGIEDGARLRVAGAGHGGDPGGRPGDLFVDIAVRPHAEFLRRGADVHAALELGYPDLALGGTFTVNTVHGEAEVEVPAGAGPGAEIRLRGKGAPRLGRRGHGDHVVHVVARPPRKLSAEERKHWEALRKLDQQSRSNDRGGGGILDKVKDLLGGE